MSGFVHPPWSGFCGPVLPAFDEAGNARQLAGHEIERVVLGQGVARTETAISGQALLEAHAETAQPLPVTPPSPRPHKALTP
jgi:hypothetical protein